MRNPERIEPILELVEQEWKKNPDMRLGQFMWFIARGDPFYVEDDYLVGELAKRNDEDNPIDEMSYYVGDNPWEDALKE